jgi:hypothetical protein
MNTVDPQNKSHNALNEIAKKPAKYAIYSEEQTYRHMTQRRSDKEQLLYTITDDVLFNAWDAFCISIDQQYREEYLPFLTHVFDLLRTTDDGFDLYEYLVFVEETNFGSLKGDALTRRRASRVVDLLLEYRDTIFNNAKEKFKISKEVRTNHPEIYPA